MALYNCYFITLLILHHADCMGHLDLLRNLFDPVRYDIDLHPFNYSDPLEVNMTTSLYQVLNLDERREELQLHMWILFEWRDPYLTWEPERYGGIEETTVQWDRVWTPDISLFNRSDENRENGLLPKSLISISSSGYVRWSAAAFLKTACNLDMEYYPYDIQECVLIFRSWSEDGSKLVLINTSSKVDLYDFIGNSEWDLINTFVEQQMPLSYGNTTWPQIVIRFGFQRKTLWYTFNLIVPCMLLVVVGIFGFFLSPDSGEKVTLNITLLLAIMLVQLMIAETQPPTSEVVPLLTQFFCMTILVLVLSTISAILVMVMFQYGDRGVEVPHCLTGVVRCFAVPLFMRSRVHKTFPQNTNKCTPIINVRPAPDNRQKKTIISNQPEQQVPTTNNDENKNAKQKELTKNKPSVNSMDTDDIGGYSQNTLFQKPITRTDRKKFEQLAYINEDTIYACHCSHIPAVKQLCRSYFDKEAADKEKARCKEEWEVIADVTDRFLLITFTIIIISACLGIFMQITDLT